MKVQHYKLLDGFRACHGGCMTYKPGVWTKPIDNPGACERGYHTCARGQIMEWLEGTTAIYHCDTRKPVKSGNKYVSRSIRLGKKVMGERELRHLACDFSAHVLHFYEGRFPSDSTVRYCIATAREYADGRATPKALVAVVCAAGNTLAYAAGNAARATAAAWAALAATAGNAAAAAIWAANATGAIVWNADGDTEKQWQQKRLALYLRGGKPWIEKPVK